MMHTGSKRDGRSRKGKLDQEHLNQEYCSHWVLGLAAGRKVGSQGDVALFAVLCIHSFGFVWSGVFYIAGLSLSETKWRARIKKWGTESGLCDCCWIYPLLP